MLPGTAQKCHFCAHRVEAGLAPACAVVCPTEAIIPGDFHDPDSRVSRMRAEFDLTVRKPEAGTGPNVLYRDADPAGLDPLRADASGGYMWAGRGPGAAPDVERFQSELEDSERRARAVYDVDHRAWWGGTVSAYLWTKSIAAGALLALAALLGPLLRAGADGAAMFRALPAIGLVFLTITTILLIADLKRPARFLFLLTRPNTGSWLVRGAWILMGYGAILSAWLAWAVLGTPGGDGAWALAAVGAVGGVLAAGYTGWLFGQCRGRVLWLARGLWVRFALHAAAAGAATVLLAGSAVGLPLEVAELARWLLIATLVAEALFGEISHRAAPRDRAAEFRRVTATIATGPFRSRRRAADIVGFYLAMPLLVIGPQVPTAGDVVFWTAGAVLVLVGLALDQDVIVRAGQAVPIS